MEPFISKENFDQEVRIIGQSSGKRLEAYLKVVEFCHQVLERYRSIIIQDGFADHTEEIKFFKNHKQVPQESLIYYTLLRAYELEVPSGEAHKKEYIDSKIDSIHRFFSANLEFKQYVEMDNDYLDEVYYTRKFFDIHWSPTYIYYRDPVFSTSRDLLLSEIAAQKKFLIFLQEEIYGKSINKLDSRKLQWTSSKVALTELVYALYHSGVINNGNATLKEIAVEMQSFLGIDLGDYHHTFIRLRERSQPLKFLEQIKDRLAQRMQELDQ